MADELGTPARVYSRATPERHLIRRRETLEDLCRGEMIPGVD